MAKRSNGHHSPAESGLALDAVPFDKSTSGAAAPLLTPAQRRRLAALATRLRLAAHTTVFREGDPLSWIFIIGEGLVKSFRELSSGRRRIVAFLHARDVFGLSENGRYVNTTQTITASTLYRIPHDVLAAVLQRDAELQFKFLLKTTHELREGQRQTILMGRRDAAGRVAMFLKNLERDIPIEADQGHINVPMSRTDMAEYLGLSLEAVSRATHQLAHQKIVAFERHAARVLDRDRFESVVAAA